MVTIVPPDLLLRLPARIYHSADSAALPVLLLSGISCTQSSQNPVCGRMLPVLLYYSAPTACARKINTELILSQHNCQCAQCSRSGNCVLQKIANDLGILDISYAKKIKTMPWNQDFPLIRDESRCVKCMRCVQVCSKVQGISVWDVVNAGGRTTVGVNGGRKIEDRLLLRYTTGRRRFHLILPDNIGWESGFLPAWLPAAANIDAYLGYQHKLDFSVTVPEPHFIDRTPWGRCNTKEREACDRKQDPLVLGVPNGRWRRRFEAADPWQCSNRHRWF